MAFYIRHCDNEENKVVESEWKLPSVPPKIKPERVVEIQADGAELDTTLKMFNGLLNKEHRQYTIWSGSLAKVVYERVEDKFGK